MLELDTTKRISASECLKSPFLSIINTEENVPDLLPSVLSNIYKLNAREKIQQATIALIVHNIQQNDQVERLKGIFELLDLNKDGQLTYAEIKQAFKKIFPDNYITEDKMQLILEKMDDNKDGVISYEEFLRVTLDEKILLEKNNLKLAFDKFDLNKDEIQLNNSSKISSKFLPNQNSLIINHENFEPSLLFKEIINLKNIINKLKLELLNINSENRTKDEEIKKVQKILEYSKKKLKEKNYLQKLNEQNQMLKLKDAYQKLQEKIKQKEDENKSIFNKLKLIVLEVLINDNDKKINKIKEKVDEYKDNLQYNKNLELNFYYFYKDQFFQNHKYIVSVIEQINSKSNTINLLKENLKKLKDKYYEMNENKKN